MSLSAKTKRRMRRGIKLKQKDPVRWILERTEWSYGYDAGGAWNYQCPMCKGNRPDGFKGIIPTGHQRGCIMKRALRVYRSPK